MIRAGVLAALVLLAGAATAAPRPTNAPPLLRSEGWTEVSVAGFESHLAEPRECLARRSETVDAGRALFRSPALFGGPAARIGLSCNACHAGGRINTAFLLPELTDRAGHADVTSEWASKVRGDGVLNPMTIPDLAGAASRPAYGAARTPSLRTFIRDVIVDEFQGPPPPEEALDAVVAYVAALEPCAGSHTPITLASAADDVRRALDSSRAYHRTGAAATSSLLLYAAQDAVARIVERLPTPRFAAERRTLALLSQELGDWRASGVDDATVTSWRVRFDASIERLSRREAQTYFAQRTLARDLRRASARS